MTFGYKGSKAKYLRKKQILFGLEPCSKDVGSNIKDV
jgi:hypothetical protein